MNKVMSTRLTYSCFGQGRFGMCAKGIPPGENPIASQGNEKLPRSASTSAGHRPVKRGISQTKPSPAPRGVPLGKGRQPPGTPMQAFAPLGLSSGGEAHNPQGAALC